MPIVFVQTVTTKEKMFIGPIDYLYKTVQKKRLFFEGKNTLIASQLKS